MKYFIFFVGLLIGSYVSLRWRDARVARAYDKYMAKYFPGVKYNNPYR